MKKLLHQRFRKFRRSPVAAAPALPATITVFDYLEDKLDERVVEEIDEILPSMEKETPTWIDVSGNQPISVIQRLGEIFGLHPLTLEDILSKDQRPKVESFENKPELSPKRPHGREELERNNLDRDEANSHCTIGEERSEMERRDSSDPGGRLGDNSGYMYIAIQKPSYDLATNRIHLQQVSIILTPHNVLSIHERVPSPISPIRWRMHSESGRIRKLGTDYLAYVIADASVDEYFVIMEKCEDLIQEIDAKLSIRPESDTIEQIHLMRQEIIMLRRSIWPLREVISALSKTESPLFDEGIKVYLKDLQDHIFQIVELIEVYRDMITGMQNIYLSTVSNQMNEVMKTLTMIASIFIPLTLITGCYGMNFKDMPELSWKYGYPLTVGMMIALGLGMFYFFRRKRWL